MVKGATQRCYALANLRQGGSDLLGGQRRNRDRTRQFQPVRLRSIVVQPTAYAERNKTMRLVIGVDRLYAGRTRTRIDFV